MKKIIDTIKNIFAIEDLRKRIINTFLYLLMFRIGSYIVLPGIDSSKLADSQGGMLGLINTFAGGAFGRASILALGIMPYISASIVIQLLTIAVPQFQRMAKEGEEGRTKLNQYTRIFTILITFIQAFGFLATLRGGQGASPIVNDNFGFLVSTIVFLIAGTVFTMWLGERITDKGIGNGISLIIMVGILARFPQSVWGELNARSTQGGGGLFVFLVEIVFLLLVIAFTILLVQGTRKIPVQYAKRVIGNKQYGGARQWLPLKVNQAGVMPIIFAQAIMFIPGTIAQLFRGNPFWDGVAMNFNSQNSWIYDVSLALTIIAFTYFYTAITINPVQIADEMKRNNGFVPGVKPGKSTADFIDNVMSRITLPGSIFLALIAIMPGLTRSFGMSTSFAQFFGGTSLLIMVGVLLDTLQQIESQLTMRHYDGLMKGGNRIKGRTQQVQSM
ncbi:MAG: preprotein translocase subunit SecY [Bacteroidetes bacterium]|nr:preprotein translocase subunit SecY [Bacteroidota bacterium]